MSRRLSRLQRKSRGKYQRNPGIDARGLYGYTARSVRCDRCLCDYLPQHTHRLSRWTWWCGNCTSELRTGAPVRPRAVLRYRYADDPRMLAALGLTKKAAA